MPDQTLRSAAPAGHAYPSLMRLVCPKCGSDVALPQAAKHRHLVEYAGVCGSAQAPRLRCDAVMTVHVSSHVFPI